MDKTQEMLSEGSKTKFSKESCSKYVQVLLDILSRIMTNTKVDVYSTKYSQAVTHPSTNLAQCCLTSVIGRELVLSTWYGRRHEKGAKVAYWSNLTPFLEENFLGLKYDEYYWSTNIYIHLLQEYQVGSSHDYTHICICWTSIYHNHLHSW